MLTTEEKLIRARDDAYVQAIKALASYKFWMFGYHAARWVNYNKLCEVKNRNPFRKFVSLAKSTIEADWPQ